MQIENQLQSLQSIASQHHTPILSAATQERLTQHIATQQPRQCVEIGTAIGYSSLCIASLIQARSGSLISFEISHPSYWTAHYHLWQTQLSNLRIYHTDFLQAPLNDLIVYPCDFVFVDGMKAQYSEYLQAIISFCRPWATIVCDDILAYSDKTASLLDRLDQQKLPYDIISLADGDGIAHITVP